MKLLQALPVKKGDLIAFVGAGGKTTAMLLLANELVDAGFTVIVTTTTKMANTEKQAIGDYLAIDEAEPPDPVSISARVKKKGALFLYADEIPGKVRGFSAASVDDYIRSIAGCDVILIEADGSRRLPLKAAFEHEPVLPETTTKIVTVAGLNALGTELDADHVYGLSQIKDYLGPELPERVTPEVFSAILLHPSLTLKDTRAGRQRYVLLNRCTSENRRIGKKIAGSLIRDIQIDGVLLASVKNRIDPVCERINRVGIVILAAGLSERMGAAKVLLPWGERTVIDQCVDQALASSAAYVAVVSGEWHEEIALALQDREVFLVNNPLYRAGGMISSLQAGIRLLSPLCNTFVLMMGDMPFVTSGLIDDVIRSYAEGLGEIILPHHHGRRGHPALFGCFVWPELMQLGQGQMPRAIVAAHEDKVYLMSVEDDAVLFDLDTPEDYQEGQKRRDA